MSHATAKPKRQTTTVRLREVAAMRKPAGVDLATGVISGVKLLGHNSANGRRYSESAVSKAAKLYEGAKVNVNHRKGPGDRDYRDRIGVIRNVEARGDGLYGDLHFNPKHALAEQLAWDAEHAPENVGLSHDAEGRTRNDNGSVLVEEITKVHSVDLVSDPATVRSLYESEDKMDYMGDGAPTTEETPSADAAVKQSLRDAMVAILDGEGDKKTKLAKLKGLLKAEEDILAAVNGEAAPAEAPMTEEPTGESAGGATGNLQEQVKRLQARELARKILAESQLPQDEPLVAAMAGCPDDNARKALVESIRTTCATGRVAPAPRSTSGFDALRESQGEVPKGEEFVKAFRR